jgi:acyl carrier protein
MDEMNGMGLQSRRREGVMHWLARRVAEELAVPVDEVDVTAPFASFGISSIVGVTMSGEIADAFDVNVSPMLLWDYPTIERLADYIEVLRLEKHHAS